MQADLTELGQGSHRLSVLGTGIAVAEVTAEIEPQPVGERDRLGNGSRMLREPGGHCWRGGQDVAEVPPPLGLRCIKRCVQADRDERILQWRS